MTVRLNKFLSQAGICSRREADRWIEEGKVRVNGRVVQELGLKIDEFRDRVVADGRVVKKAEERLAYILLYKPAGYVVTVKDPFGRPTVMELIGRLPYRVYPVGRLDVETEGLLLLTNDGEMSFRLTHPRFEVKKVYRARIEGKPLEEDLDKLRKGVFLEGKRTAPAKISLIRKSSGKSLVRVEIHEGRKREVRKMFEAIGYRTDHLLRLEFGGLTLEGLKPGQWRYLNGREVARLKSL